MKRLLVAAVVALSAWGQTIVPPAQPPYTTNYLYLNKMHWMGNYLAGQIYNSQDLVALNGSLYVSKVPNNKGNDPTTQPTFWDLLPGGAVGDWITMGNKPLFDIRTYGADPSGAADSTTAIQTAATAARAVNGTILIPTGTFKVSSPVQLCNNWNYANVWGTGNGSVILPTTAFPQTNVTPGAAVFNTDCGVGNGVIGGPGSQPNNAAGPSFRDFRISFPQNFTVSSRTQLAHWTGLNLNNTNNPRIEHVTIEDAWDGMTMKASYGNNGSGLVWQTSTGRAFVADVGISAYDISIDIDGMLDSSRFIGIHLWPYGNFINYTWIYDPAVIGYRIGRADDLNIDNGLCGVGKCMQFVAGADGQTTFTKITGMGFDGNWAIDMTGTGYSGSAAPNVQIVNSTMSFNPTGGPVPASSYYLIKYARGTLNMIGGYVNASAYANPPIYIDDTFAGGTEAVTFQGVGMYAQNISGVSFFRQVNDPATTNMTINLTGNTWFAWPSVQMTVPLIDIQQTGGGSARLVFNGNIFTGMNVLNTALKIAQDDYHNVSGNVWGYNAGANVGWTLSLPPLMTGINTIQGIYQDQTGAWQDLKITSTTTNPTLQLNDGAKNYWIDCQAGTCYYDLFNPGGWTWRYNNGTSYVTNGNMDYLGNFAVRQSVSISTGVAAASLPSPTAGYFTWCTNCMVATPCTAGGSGAWAFANGTRYACPF